MKSQQLAKLKMPNKPGIYIFKQKAGILYIGKATNLKNRVRSYFSKDLIKTRGPQMVDMVFKSTTVSWQETDSVLEALILEAKLIKKHLPYYNVKEKDDKSFLCVVVTKEEFPQVLMVRKKDIDQDRNIACIERGKTEVRIDTSYGPFTNPTALREALKIIRRIFPFRDTESLKPDNYEFYKQLGL